MMIFKEEYIDPELKLIVMELKNNLFEQQFGFERQICALINKLTSEIKVLQEKQHSSHFIERSEVRLMFEHEA